MAKKTKARNQGRNQGASSSAPESAEQPVSDEIRRAGERIGYPPPPPTCTTYVGDVEDRIALLRQATDEIISLAVSPEPECRNESLIEALRLVRSVRMNLEMDVSEARKGTAVAS
jgi:hypothetical protein